MKIYLIKKDYSFASADIVESLNGADSLDLSVENLEILPDFRFGWLTNESNLLPDFTILNSDLLVCDARGQAIVARMLPTAIFSEIKIGEVTFYVCSHIPVLTGCLNMKKSNVKRFSNGDIMEVSSPVFLPNEYPNLFTIEEMPSAYFCTEAFKDEVVKERASGLLFEECPVKAKSWF
ncbi:MAG: hypothetical protein LIP02_13385 [Bacteroidales bacterium]|nr:hypothetical protein [Bacteroidales bacterium]